MTRPEPPAAFFHGRDATLRDLMAWLEKARHAEPLTVKPRPVILSDIEGCLNLDPLTYDHDVLNIVRQVNEHARWDNALPMLTLCTGRQSPFVDAVSAFLSVELPIIFEGGCGLFFPLERPGRGRYAWHPEILAAERAGTLAELEAAVMRAAHDMEATQSLGKGRLLTFHAPDGLTVDEMVDGFSKALDHAGLKAELTRSANAVDISVPGVTKGTAVRWLLDEIERRGGPMIDPGQLMGIGDAPNDAAFLDVVGVSVAPCNALPAIKDRVDFVSEMSDAKAVAETVIRAVRENLGDAG